jgi:hypothetical protein
MTISSHEKWTTEELAWLRGNDLDSVADHIEALYAAMREAGDALKYASGCDINDRCAFLIETALTRIELRDAQDLRRKMAP